MTHARTAFKPTSLLAALVAAAALSLAVLAITAVPAFAAETGGNSVKAATLGTSEASEVTYSVEIDGYPYITAQGVFGVPGEKMTLKAKTLARDESWTSTEVKDVTYTWKANSKLKATAKGDKLVIKKLPKVGKYAVQVTAYDKEKSKLATIKFNVIVKKKPGIKISMLTRSANNKPFGTKNMSTVNASADMPNMLLSIDKAYWGWNNNTKKSFYTWKIKNLNTGKVAVWNTKTGNFKKNAFVSGNSIAGDLLPKFMGHISKTGKYQITATVYHSNKAIETATKTITVV